MANALGCSTFARRQPLFENFEGPTGEVYRSTIWLQPLGREQGPDGVAENQQGDCRPQEEVGRASGPKNRDGEGRQQVEVWREPRFLHFGSDAHRYTFLTGYYFKSPICTHSGSKSGSSSAINLNLFASPASNTFSSQFHAAFKFPVWHS